MRYIPPVLLLWVAGCAAFMSEKERELGVINSQAGTNVAITVPLPRNARYIRFDCNETAKTSRDERVIASLSNHSGHPIEMNLSLVAPGSSVQLFEGTISELCGDRRFLVATWAGRASCVIHLHFFRVPTLTSPIRVLCLRSSPPF